MKKIMMTIIKKINHAGHVDSQVCINTPIVKKSNITKTQCDNPYKLFVGLFYMPH